MHVLIIPSERLVPEHNKLEGIFPYHQAVILAGAGHRVGALSIELSFSIPMIVKGIVYKLFRRNVGNATGDHSVLSLIKLGANKVFAPTKFIREEISQGVKIYRIDALYRRRPVSNKNHLSWVRAGVICFEQYVKDNGRPQVIHAHEAIYAGMLAQEISRKWKIPYVLTEHSTFYATGKLDTDIFSRVKKAYQNATKLIAVSNSFAAFLNTKFRLTQFSYLPNVLDPELESSGYERQSTGKDRFGFLNIALLKPIKDQKTLINAFKIVVQHSPTVELRIGGFGPLQNELETLVHANGLQHHIKFLGELTRADVIKEIKSCDCFVLSSKYETFGVVLIEAMLFGKPVVTTNVGVAPDIITERTGLMVEAGNEKKLAAAMIEAMQKQEELNSDTIRNFSIELFGKDAFVNQMNKIYSEVA